MEDVRLMDQFEFMVGVLQVLDDEVRSMLCPDNITTNDWLEVCLLAAHIVGMGTHAQ
jgi:2-iminoacetate synthase ThiH